MKLSELRSSVSLGQRVAVELHSVELALYVPFVKQAQTLLPLLDEAGQVIKYRSRYAGLKALQATGLETADVVHVSPYDEMIGIDSTPGQSEMRETVDLTRVG